MLVGKFKSTARLVGAVGPETVSVSNVAEKLRGPRCGRAALDHGDFTTASSVLLV